jgi:hypothetical protein
MVVGPRLSLLFINRRPIAFLSLSFSFFLRNGSTHQGGQIPGLLYKPHCQVAAAGETETAIVAVKVTTAAIAIAIMLNFCITLSFWFRGRHSLLGVARLMRVLSTNSAQGRHLLNMRMLKCDEKRCLNSESCGIPSSIFVDFIVHHRESSFFTVTALMFMQKIATFGNSIKGDEGDRFAADRSVRMPATQPADS